MNLFNQNTTYSRAIFQALFWSSVWVVIMYLNNDSNDSEFFVVRLGTQILGITLVIAISYLFLIPSLLIKKQYLIYFIGVIALLIIVGLLIKNINEWIYPDIENQYRFRRPRRFMKGRAPAERMVTRFIIQSIPLIFTLVGSTLIEIVNIANRKESEALQLKSEKLDAEMKFLRSQVNPHFLFNALNNIYSQSVSKSDDVPGNLLKLSTMLRYMLYEGNNEKIPLEKEIEYINHFVDLFKLKDSAGLNIKMEIHNEEHGTMIAPLILIPFIENAFKHSKIEDPENGWIDISLLNKEGFIDFQVSNSMPSSDHTKDKVGGIGLENTKRRLELLYPGKHDLDIHHDEAKFNVHLKLYVK